MPTRLWLAPALVAAAFLGGCGGEDDDGAPATKSQSTEAQSLGRRSAGSVVQFADCNDWRGGTRPEREATVRELRDQLTQQGERSNASPLSDKRAYATIQKTCSTESAGSLRLYKLYARVQGFSPLAE